MPSGGGVGGNSRGAAESMGVRFSDTYCAVAKLTGFGVSRRDLEAPGMSRGDALDGNRSGFDSGKALRRRGW